jgi:hypothetical protein
MTSQLSREIRKAETASKRAAAQSKKTADAFKAQAKATKQVADATEETNKSLRDLGTAVVSIELLKQAFALVKDAIAGTLERAQRLDREMGGNLTPTIEATSSAISDLKDSAVQPLIPFITTLAQGIEDTARGAEIAMRAIFGLSDATAELRAQRGLEDAAVEKLADKVDALKTEYKELEQASLAAFPRTARKKSAEQLQSLASTPQRETQSQRSRARALQSRQANARKQQSSRSPPLVAQRMQRAPTQDRRRASRRKQPLSESNLQSLTPSTPPLLRARKQDNARRICARRCATSPSTRRQQ